VTSLGALASVPLARVQDDRALGRHKLPVSLRLLREHVYRPHRTTSTRSCGRTRCRLCDVQLGLAHDRGGGSA
jgi:hypothetical protein